VGPNSSFFLERAITQSTRMELTSGKTSEQDSLQPTADMSWSVIPYSPTAMLDENVRKKIRLLVSVITSGKP